MKLLLLTLLGVVACAGSELDGQWITLGILADNPEKIQVGGPLRFLLRHIEATDDFQVLNVTFDIEENGKCEEYRFQAERDENGVYILLYSGKIYCIILWADQQYIVFYIVNEYEKGQVTDLILLVGRVQRSSPLPIKKLEELAKSKGIPFSSLQYIPYPGGEAFRNGRTSFFLMAIESALGT
ncbi:female-specific lacrimal gland protein-like [Thomomys bottae]